ncbi:VanZ family protein [Actinoplanes sp. HUAS TT8]|uniref:VanZ family protein n=1 Tax=Actinoplanes sp. HUAS TT8 TaxID=3447453 RepID=UPI003F5208B6
MRGEQFEVPALPVLLPLGGILMVLSYLWLRRRGQLTTGRLLAAWALSWYAVAVLGATMLPMFLSWGPEAGPPATYRILLVPTLAVRRRDFVLNVMMTLPLAALLHLNFGIADKLRVVRIGFFLSLSIELTQLVMILTVHGNRWADVNDLLSNTIGTIFGFVGWQWLIRSERVRNLVRRRVRSG